MGVVYSFMQTHFSSLKVLEISAYKFIHTVIVFHRKGQCIWNKILLILINEQGITYLTQLTLDHLPVVQLPVPITIKEGKLLTIGEQLFKLII